MVSDADWCPRCGTIILTSTTTGERYCPLCRT